MVIISYYLGDISKQFFLPFRLDQANPVLHRKYKFYTQY